MAIRSNIFFSHGIFTFLMCMIFFNIDMLLGWTQLLFYQPIFLPTLSIFIETQKHVYDSLIFFVEEKNMYRYLMLLVSNEKYLGTPSTYIIVCRLITLADDRVRPAFFTACSALLGGGPSNATLDATLTNRASC